MSDRTCGGAREGRITRSPQNPGLRNDLFDRPAFTTLARLQGKSQTTSRLRNHHTPERKKKPQAQHIRVADSERPVNMYTAGWGLAHRTSGSVRSYDWNTTRTPSRRPIPANHTANRNGCLPIGRSHWRPLIGLATRWCGRCSPGPWLIGAS